MSKKIPMRPLIIFSFNSISVYPVFRLILKGLDKSLFKSITIYESFMDDMSTRFNLDYEHIVLMHFRNASAFNNQSIRQKITKYALSIRNVWSCVKGDAVFYTCDLEVLALAVIFRKLRNSQCIILYHQFETIEPHSLNLVKRIALFILRRVKGIGLAIFPEKNRMSYFTRLINRPDMNTFVFPNTCYAKPETDFSQPSEKFRIGHIGALSFDAFYLQSLLDGMAGLSPDDFEILFVGVRNEQIASHIRSMIPHAQIIGWLNHDELQSIYRKLDLGFILYKPLDFNTDYCAPNKLYEYWSYGIPAIAPVLKGLVDLFDDPVKGLLVNFDDPQEVTRGVIKVTQMRNAETRERLVRLFHYHDSFQLVNDKFTLKIKSLIHG